VSNVKMCDMCGAVKGESDIISLCLQGSCFEKLKPGERYPSAEFCGKCYSKDKELMQFLKALNE